MTNGGVSKGSRMRNAMMISGHGVNGAVVHCLLLSRFLAVRGHSVLLMHQPVAWIARQPGLEQIELFATLFARAPRELVRTAQRMRVFQPVDTHMSSAHSYGRPRTCSWRSRSSRRRMQCTYSCTGHSIISQSDRACAIPHGRSSRRGRG